MSRRESDREDLLREATALVERAELRILGESAAVVVGFRRDGSLSVFFGADPVYQFNSVCELRRAYADGLLYKAEQGRLVALRRERNEHEVALIRRELTADETTAFLTVAHDRLAQLHDAIARGEFVLTGQVPAVADVLDRVRGWLARLGTQLAVARAPNAR